MKACTEKQYIFAQNLPWVEESGDWSQENVTIFGILIACKQPNILKDNPYSPEPDNFYWCHRLIWLFVK